MSVLLELKPCPFCGSSEIDPRSGGTPECYECGATPGNSDWNTRAHDTRPMETPRVVDNDRDEITATLDGKEIRGWSYADEAERRVKMLVAREFCEGWFQATRHTGVTP